MSYKPSEKQKRCKFSFCYAGREFAETYCQKDESAVTNDFCEKCEKYKSRFIYLSKKTPPQSIDWGGDELLFLFFQ